MPETSPEAVGLPSALDPRHTFLFQGEWCTRGGFVGKRGEFAVLQSRGGLTIMVDRKAVELAALALGVEIRR